MKIAFNHQIFSEQEYGGISRYFVELAKHIALEKKNECTLKVTSLLHINKYLESEIDSFVFQGLKSPNFKGSGRLCKAVNSLLSPILLNFFDPELIHDTYYNFIYHNKSRAKKIITVHDMTHEIFPEQFSKTDKTSEMKKNAIKVADHIICVSKNTQKDLVKIFDVDINKTSVVHHGYSLFKKTQKKYEVNDKPYLLYVGGRHGYKNFSKFIEAYAKLVEIQKNFDVVIFSSQELTQDEVMLFNRLNIQKTNIKLVNGNDIKLSSFYLNASLFIYPSLYEGFGIPLLEAMSHGCPVVCSNTSSIPEVVGNAAFQFDPYSLDSISNAIETVLNNNKLRQSLISKGFQQVQKFSWEKCASETFDVYKKVLQ